MTGRPTLDYAPRLVEANRAYRITADRDLSLQARYWTPGTVVTNQGAEGACVGHGVVNEYLASPVRGRPWVAGGFVTPTQASNLTANDVYHDAQKIDEWEGEAYDGTSVRAGMLVGRQRGWWSGFQWAFTMPELRTALETGPVVIGVEWTESMYTAPNAQVRVSGSVVGGHCLLLTGYSPNWNKLGPHYRWRNSWGPSYGANGNAYIAAHSLSAILFDSGGEAAQPVGRAA
jgi:hypothetical protein